MKSGALVLIGLLFAAPSFAAAKQKKAESQKPQGVTLDVKDEDVHAILRSMQQQCGIKNLVIDPGVQGKGTFMFSDVPCSTAFQVVLGSMGLSSVVYSSSLIDVAPRKN